MFKGPGVMPGYYKNKEKTEECLSADGWLCSGDVGQVFPNGSLKIIDRAKNIFKLSQGEYIAPEKLENMFIKSEWIGQIWIYGDSLRDHIISFVVVD
jgi:long-chain acyl-CoA synthetase|tara:strand:+ start:1592 stop:1882 length:291 start_codon:yes stop_codon:yes gene_type:complete